MPRCHGARLAGGVVGVRLPGSGKKRKNLLILRIELRDIADSAFLKGRTAPFAVLLHPARRGPDDHAAGGPGLCDIGRVENAPLPFIRRGNSRRYRRSKRQQVLFPNIHLGRLCLPCHSRSGAIVVAIPVRARRVLLVIFVPLAVLAELGVIEIVFQLLNPRHTRSYHSNTPSAGFRDSWFYCSRWTTEVREWKRNKWRQFREPVRRHSREPSVARCECEVRPVAASDATGHCRVFCVQPCSLSLIGAAPSPRR